MDLGVTYGAPSDSSSVYVFPHGGGSLLSAGNVSSSGFTFDYTYRRFKDGVPASSISAGLMFVH